MSCMAHFPSWPGLSRPSTSSVQRSVKDVDARDKPGMTENPYSAGLAADGAPAEPLLRGRLLFHDSYGENGALVEHEQRDRQRGLAQHIGPGQTAAMMKAMTMK